jgi:hypothetical protein
VHYRFLDQNIRHFKFKFELFNIFLQEQRVASAWTAYAREVPLVAVTLARVLGDNHRISVLA